MDQAIGSKGDKDDMSCMKTDLQNCMSIILPSPCTAYNIVLSCNRRAHWRINRFVGLLGIIVQRKFSVLVLWLIDRGSTHVDCRWISAPIVESQLHLRTANDLYEGASPLSPAETGVDAPVNNLQSYHIQKLERLPKTTNLQIPFSRAVNNSYL